MWLLIAGISTVIHLIANLPLADATQVPTLELVRGTRGGCRGGTWERGGVGNEEFIIFFLRLKKRTRRRTGEERVDEKVAEEEQDEEEERKKAVEEVKERDEKNRRW